MLIGIPKEIKSDEHRVSLTPAGVRELITHGHQVMVQHEAGLDAGFSDDAYQAVGAQISHTADAVFAEADIIIKVKEPQPAECAKLKEGQTLLTYLHLAPDPEQTKHLLASGATCIAYETITGTHQRLPLLAPMSEIAGRVAIQKAAYYLESSQQGRGILCGGVPGVSPATIIVIGGGVAGLNAARMAMGLGAEVMIIDRDIAVLRSIDDKFNGRIRTLFSTTSAIEHHLRIADAVIGAVLVPGAATPKLVTQPMLAHMKPNAVLVDIAIDQGGCFATSRPTTHKEPTYVIDDMIHYCVANIPSVVARTATFALTNASLPYILTLANRGIKQALLDDPHLLNGLNIHRGQVTCQAVAQALGYDYVESTEALQ